MGYGRRRPATCAGSKLRRILKFAEKKYKEIVNGSFSQLGLGLGFRGLGLRS